MIPLKTLERVVAAHVKMHLPTKELKNLVRDIKELEQQWEEVDPRDIRSASCGAVNCLDCWLEEQQANGSEIRVLYRRMNAMKAARTRRQQALRKAART